MKLLLLIYGVSLNIDIILSFIYEIAFNNL